MRSFGHLRPIRDADGNISQHKPSPVGAITRQPLGPQFGPDARHRLIVTLDGGDVITMRPERTQRPVSGAAADLYRYLVRCEAARFDRRVKEIVRQSSQAGRAAWADARRQARKERGW